MDNVYFQLSFLILYLEIQTFMLNKIISMCLINKTFDTQTRIPEFIKSVFENKLILLNT